VKLEQLQSAWQAHYQQAAASQPSIIAAETMKTSAKFESTLVRRDWIETCAAVFVIVMFGSALFKGDLSLISVLGVLIIIASTLRVIWVLHSTRKRQSTVPPDHSLLECAQVELQRVEVQIKLLQRVTFWYTTPLTVGAIVFVYGLMEPWWVASIAAGGFLVIFMLVGLVIHRMNQQCVNLTLIPLQAQLLDLIESLESTSVD
jgi:Ca2+/Na+ antiporter